MCAICISVKDKNAARASASIRGGLRLIGLFPPFGKCCREGSALARARHNRTPTSLDGGQRCCIYRGIFTRPWSSQSRSGAALNILRYHLLIINF